MLLRLMMMIEMFMMMMMMMVYFLRFSFLHFICLNFACFYSLPFCLAFPFSTLPFMTRVRRSNARKDCLVCIVGVIAGGHYDQGRDSECKAYYYFLFISFACIFDLPDCTLTLMLMTMTAIMTEIS